MQDYGSFDARYNMGLNLENRFCRLAVHCGGRGIRTPHLHVLPNSFRCFSATA